MIQEFKKIGKTYAISMIWILGLLWPMLGIHADGTMTFSKTLTIWSYILISTFIATLIYLFKISGKFNSISKFLSKISNRIKNFNSTISTWVWLFTILFFACVYPYITDRYLTDVAITILIYICLGLGLNIVVGLAGMLDLGYIAFYGVGAYIYALLNTTYGLAFWFCLPIAGISACITGCFVGYPTLRMRGDYLAIVTLGFGEIIRIILNNWMTLTNGPNGILGIESIGWFKIFFENGISFETIWVKKLQLFYYFILTLAIFVILGVYRLHFSRVGRAWEAIREDETAAELMGVNSFFYKLLAYAMGAFIAGLAGAFFAARMKFVSPESFTFIESIMVLSMVVLGGMGSIPGIVLGVVALISLPEVFREFESYRMLIFGAAMIIMMLFRPAGLIPNRRIGNQI